MTKFSVCRTRRSWSEELLHPHQKKLKLQHNCIICCVPDPYHIWTDLCSRDAICKSAWLEWCAVDGSRSIKCTEQQKLGHRTIEEFSPQDHKNKRINSRHEASIGSRKILECKKKKEKRVFNFYLLNARLPFWRKKFLSCHICRSSVSTRSKVTELWGTVWCCLKLYSALIHVGLSVICNLLNLHSYVDVLLSFDITVNQSWTFAAADWVDGWRLTGSLFNRSDAHTLHGPDTE